MTIATIFCHFAGCKGKDNQYRAPKAPMQSAYGLPPCPHVIGGCWQCLLVAYILAWPANVFVRQLESVSFGHFFTKIEDCGEL